MEEIGLDFCFTGVGEELRKTVCCILLGEDGGRPGGGERSSPFPCLGPGRPAPAPLGDGSSELGGRLRFAGENNEGGRERNGRGGEGVTGNRGLEGNGVGTPSQEASGRVGERGHEGGGAIAGEGQHVLECPAIL
jgi:hypothetical protein